MLLVSVANAAVTKDRWYRFGEDPFEGGSPGNPASVAYDSATVLPTTTDYMDMNVLGSPTYAAVSGSIVPSGSTVSLSFDGTPNKYAHIPGVFGVSGGLGALGEAEEQDLYGGPTVLDFTEGGMGRSVQGWVKPTGSTVMTQQDILWDTSQISVFISAPISGVRYWGFTHGDPNGNDGSTPGTHSYITAKPVVFGEWHHFFHRSQDSGGNGVLYIDGEFVGHIAQDMDQTPEDPATMPSTAETLNNNFNQVVGSNITQTGNWFQGEVDEFKFEINGNNNATGVPASQAWGSIVIGSYDAMGVFNSDIDYVREIMVGKDRGDVDLDGDVDQDDVDDFVAGWRSSPLLINNFNPAGSDMFMRRRGDLDFDDDVDLADAAALRVRLFANGSGATLDLSQLVPEPTSVMLAMFGMFSLVGIRRRRS
jgi:hypothetical protein